MQGKQIMKVLWAWSQPQHDQTENLTSTLVAANTATLLMSLAVSG